MCGHIPNPPRLGTTIGIWSVVLVKLQQIVLLLRITSVHFYVWVKTSSHHSYPLANVLPQAFVKKVRFEKPPQKFVCRSDLRSPIELHQCDSGLEPAAVQR